MRWFGLLRLKRPEDGNPQPSNRSRLLINTALAAALVAGGAAGDALVRGVSPGDVILEVGERSCRSVADLRAR